MKTLLKLALFLLPMTVLAQAPQIPLTGNIGSGFNGPLINSPAVIFATDADHTMVYPEMSGSGGTIIVTSTPSLTATRNLIAPNTGIFNWVVRNNTTGGQSINVKVAGGTGVSIANGNSSVVMCDTVNCYVPGGQNVTQFLAPTASWPSWLVPTVTNPYTAPSLAVTAAYTPLSSVTGTAPVDCTTSGSSVDCAMAQATSSVDGYLSHIDWAAFNGKQAALTNPVTGPGSATANDAATFTGTGDAVQDSGVSIYLSAGYGMSIGGGLNSSSTGGGSNLAIGPNSLGHNTTGESNEAVGPSALYWTNTGSNNTAFGGSSLGDNITGSENTAIGIFAGDNSGALTANSYSTFLGYHANTSVNNLTNAMALGNGAQATASNQVVIGNAAVTDEYFGSAAGLATLHGAAFTGNSSTATNLSTNGTANQVWGMNSGATAQGWQTPGSTMTYPGANTIGVANSGNTAWRTPLFSDITGLFGSGSCSGLLKSDGTCVLASTLNVNSALTASNVQCYLQDTCPNDAIWQAPWLTASQPSLATGYPLGATDTTMTIVTLAGMPATGHVVTTHSEEMGYSYVSSSGGNSTYNITRAKHGTTAYAVPVGVGNMAGVVSETAACSTCGVLMQTVNAGGTTFGGQTNAGLEPTVGGNYAVFNAITMQTLNTYPGQFLEASLAANGAIEPSGYGPSSFDASGAAAARAAVGNCSAGQYGTATTTSGLTCAQVAYSQVSGTPSIPTVGTWGALNYPTWASGTPFVKMTGLGTFALDTNIYLTSSAIASTTNLLSGDGSGNAVSSGIAASNVFQLPSLTSGSVLFSNGSTIAQDNSNFFWDATNHRLGIGTTSPAAALDVLTTNPLALNLTSSAYATTFYLNNTSAAGHNWALESTGTGSGFGTGLFALWDATASIEPISFSSTAVTTYVPLTVTATGNSSFAGKVGIGTTNPVALLSIGSSSQFQVSSTGVSSAGAGSTDLNGSGVPEAHCLADGTGCPSLNNTIQGGIILTTATSDSTTLTYSSAYNAASCVFSPTDSTATLLTILPYLTSLATTGSVSVTINHAATVGNGATYNIVCSIWHST
jgi:hypothetical protein